MSTSPETSPARPPRFVVVSPTYNHVRNLSDVLISLDAVALPVIVVNDGATDGTAAVLALWRAGAASARTVLTHPRNLGKAAALRTGFKEAARLGFTHALTIDSDGQHAAADLLLLIAAAQADPGALIIGARPARSPGVPWGSRIGRAFSNRMVRMACGVRVSDSQSGLRCYPLEMVERLSPTTSRYCFETEIIVRAGWAGIRVVEVPIGSIYNVAGGRVTHFRLVRDSLDAVVMHAGLIARSVVPGVRDRGSRKG